MDWTAGQSRQSKKTTEHMAASKNNGTMTAMDGAGSDRSSTLAAIEQQRDVSLVRWYLTSPPSVETALRTPYRKQNTCSNNDDDEESVALQLASRLASSIPAHLQFFATAVMDFGPFHVPTEEENQRFEALQSIYCDLSENDAATDVAAPSPIIMRLSPRMIVDYAEPKSKQREALRNVVNDYLDTLAKVAEGRLLDEVDEEASNRQGKKEKDRRRRRAKKQKRKAKQRESGASDEVDVATEGTAVEDDNVALAGENNIVGDYEIVGGHQLVEPSPSSELSDAEKATSRDENATPNQGYVYEGAGSDSVKGLAKGRGGKDQISPVEDVNDLVEALASSGDSEQLSSEVETKSKKKISYLAAAAKVPKVKSKARPSAAVVAHSPPFSSPSVDSKQPCAAQTKESTAHDELEEIARLQEQLEAQRRGHLELIQQVQLKAFIAETKAASALDRSRQLERQILDATYPEVEATRVEAASVEGGPLLPHKASSTCSGKTKTKEDLELELRSQRRENLAMMNRVQMRTFLAEIKAKATEERSLQLEKLLRDAQKGEEFA